MTDIVKENYDDALVNKDNLAKANADLFSAQMLRFTKNYDAGSCQFWCKQDDFLGFDRSWFVDYTQSFVNLIYVPDRPLRQSKLEKIYKRFVAGDLLSVSFSFHYRMRGATGEFIMVEEQGTLRNDLAIGQILMESHITPIRPAL